MNQKLIQTVISECHRIEEDALYLDWPPESPDNQYHLFK